MNSKKVEYLLIGGYAVNFHGYIRTTGDIDIWIKISNENAKKIVHVIKEFGFDIPNLTDKLFMIKNKIIRMGNPPFRIEIFTSISGVDFDACFRNKIVGKFDDIDINFISLSDLKINKKESGRLKDLTDLENLDK